MGDISVDEQLLSTTSPGKKRDDQSARNRFAFRGKTRPPSGPNVRKPPRRKTRKLPGWKQVTWAEGKGRGSLFPKSEVNSKQGSVFVLSSRKRKKKRKKLAERARGGRETTGAHPLVASARNVPLYGKKKKKSRKKKRRLPLLRPERMELLGKGGSCWWGAGAGKTAAGGRSSLPGSKKIPEKKDVSKVEKRKNGGDERPGMFRKRFCGRKRILRGKCGSPRIRRGGIPGRGPAAERKRSSNDAGGF